MAKKDEKEIQTSASGESKSEEGAKPTSQSAASSSAPVKIVEFEAPKPENQPAFLTRLDSLDKKIDKVMEKLFPPEPPAPTATPDEPKAQKVSIFKRILDYELY